MPALRNLDKTNIAATTTTNTTKEEVNNIV